METVECLWKDKKYLFLCLSWVFRVEFMKSKEIFFDLYLRTNLIFKSSGKFLKAINKKFTSLLRENPIKNDKGGADGNFLLSLDGFQCSCPIFQQFLTISQNISKVSRFERFWVFRWVLFGCRNWFEPLGNGILFGKASKPLPDKEAGGLWKVIYQRFCECWSCSGLKGIANKFSVLFYESKWPLNDFNFL